MESVNNCNIIGNNISSNFNGIYLINSTNNTINGNIITDTGVGITYQDSNNTIIIGNNITNSQIQDIQMVDTTGIVMSSTAYNCGPATLATVLQNLGINVSQDVLTIVAGTDNDGTTMYGLAQAAQQQQGVFVRGLKLTVNELRSGNIVYLTIVDECHYAIFKSINGSIVYLADTDLGNINMTLDKFTQAYVQNTTTGYGYALIITNDSSDSQLNNNNTIDDNTMKTIKGTGWYDYGSNLYAVYHLGWYRENPIIKNMASGILKYYKHQTITQKARAIFKYVYKYAVTNWENHQNTVNTINHVVYHHSGNCAETARLVYLLAQDMGIPQWRIRYVHRFKYNGHGGHYWVQIFCGSNPNRDWWNWKDLDCSHAYDRVHHFAFGDYIEKYGATYGNPMSNAVREYPPYIS